MNFLSIPVRDALDVEETDAGVLLISQTDSNGQVESILLCADDVRALSATLNEWLARRL